MARYRVMLNKKKPSQMMVRLLFNPINGMATTNARIPTGELKTARMDVVAAAGKYLFDFEQK
jgi:hypothetical protein